MAESFPPVTELLPHQGPAVLIDRVVDHTEDGIRVEMRVTAANPYFVPEHGVPVWVGIELMSQAAAAYVGLRARREQRQPQAGMLLGTRRYEVHAAYFRDGALIEIRAQRDFGEHSGLAACTCTIHCGEELLAKATLVMIEIGQEHMA